MKVIRAKVFDPRVVPRPSGEPFAYLHGATENNFLCIYVDDFSFNDGRLAEELIGLIPSDYVVIDVSWSRERRVVRTHDEFESVSFVSCSQAPDAEMPQVDLGETHIYPYVKGLAAAIGRLFRERQEYYYWTIGTFASDELEHINEVARTQDVKRNWFPLDTVDSMECAICLNCDVGGTDIVIRDESHFDAVLSIVQSYIDKENRRQAVSPPETLWHIAVRYTAIAGLLFILVAVLNGIGYLIWKIFG